MCFNGWVSFQYSQSTGVLNHDGLVVGTGYSGAGYGKNDPECQQIPNVGPLPRGGYVIGAPYDHPTLGPHVMNLTPYPANEMYGRSLFRIHGDNPAHVGESSDGCIVLELAAREVISQSGDSVLQVVL